MSSKLDKSIIVAGAGLVASIFTMLVKKVREQGGTDEDIHYLATPDGEKILDEIVGLIVKAKRQTFKVMVDYTKSLTEMIRAGNYDRTSSDINEANFKIAGEGRKKKEVVLFHFGKVMSSKKAISEMSKAGYRPAFIEELLVLGVAYPELQKQFSIVAFGSFWRNPHGGNYVPYLHWGDLERHLDLSWFGNDWYERCRFAAVRK